MTRLELENREAEKACAEEGIELALLSLGDRDPDRWESDLLSRAIDELIRGSYPYAESLADNAMTPINSRTPQAKLPPKTCSCLS